MSVYAPPDRNIRYIAVWNNNMGLVAMAYPGENVDDVGNFYLGKGLTVAGPYATRDEAEATAQAGLASLRQIVPVWTVLP